MMSGVGKNNLPLLSPCIVYTARTTPRLRTRAGDIYHRYCYCNTYIHMLPRSAVNTTVRYAASGLATVTAAYCCHYWCLSAWSVCLSCHTFCLSVCCHQGNHSPPGGEITPFSRCHCPRCRRLNRTEKQLKPKPKTKTEQEKKKEKQETQAK